MDCTWGAVGGTATCSRWHVGVHADTRVCTQAHANYVGQSRLASGEGTAARCWSTDTLYMQ